MSKLPWGVCTRCGDYIDRPNVVECDGAEECRVVDSWAVDEIEPNLVSPVPHLSKARALDRVSVETQHGGTLNGVVDISGFSESEPSGYAVEITPKHIWDSNVGDLLWVLVHRRRADEWAGVHLYELLEDFESWRDVGPVESITLREYPREECDGA
ncbi:hypothetical protein [Halorientalis persicus]|uniref:hypothetical protein n=1 Tax=Halorientalis persicus TaxID=1367881 RepID=UPI001114014A|nr:hypothetical protein [Halorientalis persicus]